jgi:flagellar protein FlaG
MVTAIQPKAAPEPPVNRPAGAAVAADAAPAPAPAQARVEGPAPAEKAVITPPARAQVKLDTETMRKNLEEAIARINEMVRDGGRGLNFSLDEKLGRPIVTVKNLESGEVVRQIPTEVVVRVAHSIEDLKGMLHNEAV